MARVWFYMSDAYGVKITPEEHRLFQEWSDNDPPDEWGRLRNDQNFAAQGNRNPYIK